MNQSLVPAGPVARELKWDLVIVERDALLPVLCIHLGDYRQLQSLQGSNDPPDEGFLLRCHFAAAFLWTLASSQTCLFSTSLRLITS